MLLQAAHNLKDVNTAAVKSVRKQTGRQLGVFRFSDNLELGLGSVMVFRHFGVELGVQVKFKFITYKSSFSVTFSAGFKKKNGL